MAEDELVEWHHWRNGDEFEQVLGVGDEEGNLSCCSPWGHEVRHDCVTELNRTEFHRLMSRRIIPTTLEKGPRFPGIGPLLTFWSLMGHFGTVMVPLGVSLSVLVCDSECILRIKASSVWLVDLSAILHPLVILSKVVPCPLHSCFKISFSKYLKG